MLQAKKIPLLCVVGPTASGKTALAVELAKHFGGEVVSADSMQIYRQMQIGTARPTEAEMQGVAHHMLGFLDLTESYSVARYVQDASDCIKAIADRGHLPILAGGTGLYVSSLINGIEFAQEERNDALRKQLRERAEKEGAQVLLQELSQFDPESAQALHPNNVGRIIRAIEIYRTTGITMTEQRRRSMQKGSPYQLCMLGITYSDRQLLYQCINRRVDQMMELGLEEEARRVLSLQGGATALQAIGYKELQPYLNGQCSKEEALENLKRETRRYAKRQLTWFRRDERVLWLWRDRYPSDSQLVSAAILQGKEQLLRQ